MPFYDFNHCDYHELPLDYIMKLARESMGLKLKVVGDNLQLVNDLGQTLSSVQVSYAEKALTDTLGHDIKTYLISVSDSDNKLVFVKGNGDVVYITPSFATKAEKDVNGRNLVDYVYNVTIVGDKLRITDGDQAIVDLTIPFATAASVDINSKDLTSYAASLTVNGNNIELRDSLNRLLNSITVPYATAAASAADALHADDADHADAATVATDATNAIESVSISGDTMVFTTFGGTSYARTCPYALRATSDGLSNEITETYVANITNLNGAFQFYDAKGNLLVELVPTVDKAVHDSYNNLIADYIKSIAVQSGSNYVTVVHGTGTTDTLVIQYSETALKDSQGSVIKNTYVTELECVEDINDGHYKLVWYNNDNPKAEIGRCEVYAYAAQTDINGKALTSYVADIDISGYTMTVKDGEANTLETLSLPKEPVYVIKCSDSVDETSWTDWQSGGRTLPTPTLYKDGAVSTAWSELTGTSNVSFELTADNTNYHTFKLSKVNENPGYGSSSFQFEYIGSEAGSLPDSFAYIVRLGFFSGNLTTKKGYRVPLIAQAGGSSTLAGLSDVDVTGVTDGQVLTYDGNSSEWVPTTPGGGGGGSSATILGLYDVNMGNLIQLGNVSQSMTVEVWDITDINNPVPLEDTDVLTKIQAGQCYFKDSRYNTYSVLYDATAARIGVIYNAADQPFYMSIGYQWNTNWTIASNRPITLQ